MKRLLTFLLILLFPQLSTATDVGGIISTDTTWDVDGSPYVITSTVQIAEGITLTVEPGVTVSDGEIEVWGNFITVGTEQQMITLRNLEIAFKNKSTEIISEISMQYVNREAFQIRNTFQHGCKLIIKDSSLKNENASYVTYWDLYYFSFQLERNIFNNCKIYIPCLCREDYAHNNYFFESIISVGYNCEDETIFYNNSIIDSTVNGNSDDTDIQNNYWGTTDTAIIDEMIYDSNDDLSRKGTLSYLPILTELHPDTPQLNINISPTSEAGGDQVVFDSVTLDASGSTDSDGSLTSYQWSLQHRTNSAYNRSAEGINPTVTQLENGFYDVTLTVTDDSGLTDTDSMELAALGTLPIGNITFEGDADCECTASSSITFGPNVTVKSGAKLRLNAPAVNFKANVHVETGADLKTNNN